MDPLTHGIVTRKVVGKDRSTLLAGIAADLPFFLTYPVWLLSRRKVIQSLRKNEWPQAPRWMYTPHYIFHSIPVLLIATVIASMIQKRKPLWALAWGLHILVDIPTHSRKNWAPQFLWPFSWACVDGFSWPEILVGGFHALFKRLKYMLLK